MHMRDYHKYMMRHGESWIQAIVERIERSENIGNRAHLPLEQRWNALMHSAAAQPERMAA